MIKLIVILMLHISQNLDFRENSSATPPAPVLRKNPVLTGDNSFCSSSMGHEASELGLQEGALLGTPCPAEPSENIRSLCHISEQSKTGPGWVFLSQNYLFSLEFYLISTVTT